VKLHEMLRGARADKGWTLKDYGQHSGLDANYFSKFENGTAVPGTKTMVRLIEVLDLDEDAALLAWAKAKAQEAGEDLLGE
jgi:transcriptional regulator with XRE-family HTH domain